MLIDLFSLYLFFSGTTDKQKKFHPLSMSICSNETAVDFEFIFASVKKVLSQLFDVDYKPSILQADGAEAITNGFMAAFEYESIDDFVRLMCWAHVYRAIDKKVLPIDEPLRTAIQDDIASLQISSSSEQFAFAYKLFVDKWTAKENVAVDTFLAYFRTVCKTLAFVFTDVFVSNDVSYSNNLGMGDITQLQLV